MSNESKNTIRFIPDEEIVLRQKKQGEEGNDLLNTFIYADELTHCILSAPSNKTFTIGLFGEWGSGKSSIVKTSKEQILREYERRAQKAEFITYDAWKYSGDSFRRMFLYELQNSLGFEQNELMQRFYSHEIDETKITTSINGRKVFLSLMYIIIASLILLLIGVYQGWNTALPSGIALVALVFSLFTWMYDNYKVSINKPLLFAPEQFESCYHEMLKKAMKRHNWAQKILHYVTGGRYNRELQKLIIVIDNIDRCQPDVTYSLLSDIKSFLDYSEDVIFIVPVDVSALRKHILNTKKMGNDNTHDADEFLRKCFNVSLWIKPYHNDEMYDFTQNLNIKYSLGLSPTTVSVISREYATNPRRIIQLLNNLNIEFLHYDTDFRHKYEALIGLIAIIREEYPEDMQKLNANPVLLFGYDEKNTVFSPSLVIFLKKTRSVFENLYEERECIDKILSNSAVFSDLPIGTSDALFSYDMQAIRIYITTDGKIDDNKLSKLKLLLWDKIAKAVERETYIPDLYNYFMTTIELYKACLLYSDDYTQVSNIIRKQEAWQDIVSDFKNTMPDILMRFSVSMFKDSHRDLWKAIQSNIANMNLIDNKDNENDACFVIAVAQQFEEGMFKGELIKQFAKVYKKYPRKALEANYKLPNTFFTDDLTREVIGAISLDKFGIEDSPAWQFLRICKHTNPTNDKMLNLYFEKVLEIVPNYQPDKSKNEQLLSILSHINVVLEANPRVNLSYTLLINKVISKFTIIVTVSHSYSSHNCSLYKDCENNKENLEKFVAFFRLIGEHHKQEMLFSTQFTDFMLKNAEINNRFAKTLLEMSAEGCPIEQYATSIALYPKHDEIFVKLLRYCFNDPEKGLPRVNDGKWIRERVKELMDTIIHKGDAKLAAFLNEEAKNDTIRSILVDYLSTLELEILENLPSLKSLAVASFEQNLERYSNNVPVLCIVASNGSKKGVHTVCKAISAKLMSGQETDALKILHSLHYCNNTDKQLLIAAINATEESKINAEEKKKALVKLNGIL